MTAEPAAVPGARCGGADVVVAGTARRRHSRSPLGGLTTRVVLMARWNLKRLRDAAELQRSLREEYGEDAEAVLAQRAAAKSSQSRAETTYRIAMARNRNDRVWFRVVDVNLPAELLHTEETVYDVAVGAQRADTFPLLIVTDRRVLLARDRPLRGWTIEEEAPASEVTGAELKKRLLSGLLQVHLRHGEGPALKVGRLRRAEEVAALLRHLGGGGTPPL